MEGAALNMSSGTTHLHCHFVSEGRESSIMDGKRFSRRACCPMLSVEHRQRCNLHFRKALEGLYSDIHIVDPALHTVS